MSSIEVRAEKMAAGGDAIARIADGRVVFVRGALPTSWSGSGGAVEEGFRPRRGAGGAGGFGPSRAATVSCHAAGCGGCTWQHVDRGAQLASEVCGGDRGAARTGKLVDPVVELGGSVPPWAYRTTLRLATGEHRLGLRSRHSHDVVELDACPVSHPLLQDLLAVDSHPWETVRSACESARPLVNDRHGSSTAMSSCSAATDVGVGPAARCTRSWPGSSLRVSAASFFQSGPAAAELLVTAVRDACGEIVDARHHRRCLRRRRFVRGVRIDGSDDDHCRIVGIRLRRRVGTISPVAASTSCCVRR